MKQKISPIGDILKSVIGKLAQEKNVSKEFIEDVWKTIVRDAGFSHSRPSSFRKKVLTVRVDSSAWMQELVMQKRKILKALQRSLGKDKISEIHFKIGEF